MTPQEVTNRPSELRRAAQLSGLGVSEQRHVDTRLKWAATLDLIALVVALLFVPARDTDKTMRVYSEAEAAVVVEKE